jgi:hypothetical protein
MRQRYKWHIVSRPEFDKYRLLPDGYAVLLEVARAAIAEQPVKIAQFYAEKQDHART